MEAKEPEIISNITVIIKPDWVVNLENQQVKVGQSLLYFPEIQLNSDGYQMEVKVDLGLAMIFSEFDY